MSSDVFDFYRDYLSVKGFRPPRDEASFESRNDKKFFYKLYFLLIDKKESKQKRKVFLNYVNSKHSFDYNPINLLMNFETFYDEYKRNTFENELEYLNFINNSFKFIKKFINETGMSPDTYFNVGNPPIALKHYKEGLVDEAIIAYGCDIIKLRKKPWFKIYVNDLKNKLTSIKKRVQYSSDLYKLIENNFNDIFEHEFISKTFSK
jgi:hypothetical protein